MRTLCDIAKRASTAYRDPEKGRTRRRTGRALPFAALAAAFAVLAAGCGGGAAASGSDKGLQDVKVAFAIKSMNSSFSAIAVAQYLGYFKAEGLKVETTFLPGSTQAIQAVDAGQMNIAAPVPQALIPNIVKHSSDQRMFFNWARSQVASLAVPANSTIKNWSDFKGAKIGAQSLGSGTIPLGKALLTDQGIDPKTQVKFVAVGLGAEAYHALKTHRVDALMLFDSQYAAMENLGAHLRYFSSPLAKKLFSTGFSAKQSYIKKNPKVIAGFGRALAKANVFTTANPKAAIKMMYKVFPKTYVPGKSDQKQMSDNLKILKLRTTYLTSGEPSKNKDWGSFPDDGVKAWSDYAVHSGLIPHGFSPDQLVTNKFVSKYNDFDIKKLQNDAKNYHFDG